MPVLTDGFKTLFTFALTPTVKFQEKEVQIPGVQGGGANDITTMRNTRWRTKAPKKLLDLSESNCVVSYDPSFYTDIVTMAQVNQLITATFPDTHTLAFWGWLDEFVPQPNKEGEQPTANIKVIPSNYNSSGVETAPVYT